MLVLTRLIDVSTKTEHHWQHKSGIYGRTVVLDCIQLCRRSALVKTGHSTAAALTFGWKMEVVESVLFFLFHNSFHLVLILP